MIRAKHYYFLFFSLVLLSGCGKDLPYDTLHERVAGTWFIEEVTFREKGSVFSKDVSSNWDRYKFVFNDDETFELINHETAESYEGYWYINEYWDGNGEDSEKVQELIFGAWDENYENFKEIILNSPGATSSSLSGTNKANNGTYRFRFKR